MKFSRLISGIFRAPKSHPDQDFLPNHLEILESPPSPVAISIYIYLISFVAFIFLWSAFGQIDIIAVAQGKVQPIGSTKVVQSLEAGRLQRVVVNNGDRVSVGQVLFELDARDQWAQLAELNASIIAIRAEIFRRVEVAKSLKKRDFSSVIQSWPDGLTLDVISREDEIFKNSLFQIGATINGLEEQIQLKVAEKLKLTDVTEAQEIQITVGKERVDVRQVLSSRELGSKLQLLDARESLQQYIVALAQTTGQMKEVEITIRNLYNEIDKTIAVYLVENSQKIADLSRQEDELVQRKIRTELKVENLILRAPIDGVVNDSLLNTVGQVVSPSVDIMRIVPFDDVDIEVECYLPNKDIGFVKNHQKVSLKVDAYPFTRYGTIEGIVDRVAADSILENDAQMLEGNIQRKASSILRERNQNLVYPVTIKIEKSKLLSSEFRLIPGMMVTAEIVTGQRSILSYLLSPLKEVVSKSMVER